MTVSLQGPSLVGAGWRKGHQALCKIFRPLRRQAGSYRSPASRLVGAGLPAKASSSLVQNLQASSPASRLLQQPGIPPRRSWLASEGVIEPCAEPSDPFAGKPAPTTARGIQPRRSWLASEGVIEPCAKTSGLFAGKPAPTTARGILPRRSWLASEGVIEPCAKTSGLFAGKPAPTTARHPAS